MRTNIKKALALLLTMVMLCGLLPMAAFTVAAAESPIYTYDFESGLGQWTVNSPGTIEIESAANLSIANPNAGNSVLKYTSQSWNFIADKAAFTVQTNTDYIFTYDILAVTGSASVNAMLGTDYWFGDNVGKVSVTPSTTEWQTVSMEFNSGSKTKLYPGWQAAGSGTYYIDNLVITKKETVTPDEPEAPAAENMIVNGSFEDGTTGWTIGSAGSVVSGGQDGSYALQMKDPSTQYAAIAVQYVDVEPSSTYTLTWWSKRVSGTGIFNLYLDDGNGGTKPTATGQNWMNETSGNWVQYTMELTTSATATRLLVKFSNEAANTVGTVLIDDVMLTKNPTASFDGFLTNGDFEIGSIQNWTAFNGTAASADAAYGSRYGVHLKGNGSYNGIMSQGTVNVVAGKTYTVSYYIKVLANGMNLQIKDGTTTNGSVLVSQKHPIADYGSWTLVSLTVTPSQNGLFINFCGTGSSGTAVPANAESAYVDNIMVVEEKDPSSDGYISNGDFETGKNTPWTVYSSTAVDAAAKYEGNYGLKLAGNGDWGGLAYQQIKNLKFGQQYTVTMQVKVVSGGVNIQVKGTNLQSNDNLAAKYFATNNAGSWTELTLTFTAAATYGYINICGDGTGTAAVAYVDNIKVSRVGGEVYPEELIGYGGSSIKENSDGIGLAFKFEIAANGGTKKTTNEYNEGSATITLDDKEYQVIRMGAVITNQESVGKTDFTLDNLQGSGDGTSSSNPGKVIDVKGQYLAGLTSDSVSFAVRIVNIPDTHTDREIYARPYYVYNNNGTEEIVYGDIRSNNYDKAANPKASIKILSIGHSFSKDVMDQYLWNMFKEGGYDEVIIGYLYIGGCPMPKHLYNIQNNRADYEYGKNSNGTWQKQYNVTALAALQDEEWDYVNIQSSPDYIGGQTLGEVTLENNGGNVSVNKTEYECITPITNWIKDNARNSAVKTDYHMIWSFSQGCNLWSGIYHKNPTTDKYDQMVMYNNIIAQTKEKVLPHPAINNIIPCATSIQNGRTSLIGDNFNEPDATQGGNDGYHLNSKYGDYTAALTWYCHYSGDNANVMNGYTGDLSAEEFEAIAEAVNNAMNRPYAITESTHK